MGVLGGRMGSKSMASKRPGSREQKKVRTLPEIKEGSHCSCAKYKAEIHVWHLMMCSREQGDIKDDLGSRRN